MKQKLFAGILMAGAAALLSPNVEAAKGWGIEGEKPVRFEAKVVDIACELSGNCPGQLR